MTSATTRLPRSIAFLKIAVAVPWLPSVPFPGPGGWARRCLGDIPDGHAFVAGGVHPVSAGVVCDG